MTQPTIGESSALAEALKAAAASSVRARRGRRLHRFPVPVRQGTRAVRLQTDYIDLYQVHRPDPGTDIEETLSRSTDLIHSGKVRAVGTSAMPASDIIEAQWAAERRGLERFRTEQPPYSILSRGIEREVLPIAQRYGMGILVWGPLGQGMLTGRVRKGQQTDLRRAHIFRHLNDERRIDAVEQLIPLAENAGLPMTHLALAFAIAHPGVTSAIIRAG